MTVTIIAKMSEEAVDMLAEAVYKGAGPFLSEEELLALADRLDQRDDDYIPTEELHEAADG